MKFGAHLTLKIVSVGYIVIDTQLFIMKIITGDPLDQSLGDIQGTLILAVFDNRIKNVFSFEFSR